MAESETGTADSQNKWLDNAFLEKVLRTGENNNIIIDSYEVKPATSAGDNYGSDMNRVTVKLTRGQIQETKTLIVKRGPDKELMMEKIKKSKLFERESYALATALPEIHRILQEASPGKIEPFSAKCFYSDMDSHVPSIVMEDLKEQGFTLADRHRGLDRKHCLLVMKELARLHGASAVLLKKNPEILKPLCENIYNKELLEILRPVFQDGMKDFAEEVEKWPEYKDRFPNKLYKAADQAIDFLKTSSIPVEKEFNVIAHGDCWVNNMMFRYSEETGEVQGVRFVDYQLTYYTNPGRDILSFLYTSPSVDVMIDSQYYIQEYYNTLETTLTLLGYKHLVPTFPDLLKQIDRQGLLAVFMSGVGLSFIYADKNNIPDTEKLMSNQSKLYINEKHKEAMKMLLPHFEEKGWL